MNIQTTDSELHQDEEDATPAMRSDSLSRLASGAAKREAEKPDFEVFLRSEVYTRIDDMLDRLAETLTDLGVDETIEDLLATKNQALSDAIHARRDAEAKAAHLKQFERSEAERRHNIILELREQVAELTEKYEHQKSEGLRRHNLIIDLREKVEELTKLYEHEKKEGLRRHNIILDQRKTIEDANKKLEFHAKERKEFIRQRQYARSFRYLIKTFPARILEVIGLKKAPSSE